MTARTAGRCSIGTCARAVPPHWPPCSRWPSPPTGSPVTDLAAKVRSLTGAPDADYTVRQAAYDLRKLRGKHLVTKPGRTRRYQVPGQATRTIAALLTLRDQVIAPILAGVRRPGPGRPPNTYTRIDRDYEHLRTGMRTLFHDLAINTAT